MKKHTPHFFKQRITLLALFLFPCFLFSQTNQEIKIAVIGDFGAASLGAPHIQNETAVADLVKSWDTPTHPLDVIITTGDNNYPDGLAADIQTNLGQFYGEYINGDPNFIGGNNRFFPSTGNHDYGTSDCNLAGDISPYLNYFNLPGNELYYDFVIGDVHFFALDSDCHQADGTSIFSDQADWLETQMTNSPHPWKIVYFHHAPYGSVPNGGSGFMDWDFKSWGATAVIAGHYHLYERLQVDGLDYFISGNGGNSLHSFSNFANPSPFSQVQYDAKHGAMLITISGDTANFKSFNVDNEIVDDYDIVNDTTTTSSNCIGDLAGFTALGEHNGSKYFISNNTSQPAAAQVVAEQNGGHLVTINDQAENDFLQQNISEMVYIGLNDVSTEGTLVWGNGDPLNYININPCNFCNENSDDLDYVIMAPWDGTWSFSSLWNSRKYIVEIPCGGVMNSNISLACPDDLTYSLSNGATSILINYDTPIGSTTCPDGGLIFNLSSGPVSGTMLDAGNYNVTFEATDACGNTESCTFNITINPENMGGDCPDNILGFTTLGEFNGSKYFISNDNAQPENAQIIAQQNNGYLAVINDQAENDFLQQNISEMTYIGLNDVQMEGVLVWENGDPLNYNNINPCSFCNENSADLDYVIMAPWDGAWSFSSLWNSRKYIVEIPCSGVMNSNISLTCPDDLTYSLSNGAASVLINYDTPIASTTCLDGGLNVSLSSGSVSGTMLDAGNYNVTFEATDACGNTENCTFNITINPENMGGDCPGNILGFTTLGEFNGSKYFISNDNAQPESAQIIAQQNNGYLAVINDQAENDFLQQNISEMTYIGLNDVQTEGTLVWENGDPLNYNNINPCSFCNENSADLDYVIMAPWDGTWSFSSLWNSRKYIVEIPCGGVMNSNISLACPNDLTYSLSNGATSILINYDTPIASTTCLDGGLNVSLSSGSVSGTMLDAGNYNVTFEATDACGNTENCTFNITINPENMGGDCPDNISGFTTLGEFNGSKYFISNDNAQPESAQIIAQQNNGYLAVINDQAENDFLQQNISEMTYIGLNDVQTEGTLVWENGDPLNYNNINPCSFCNGNSADLDYVIMAPWDGAWSFSSLWNSRKYIVEIPCSPPLVNPNISQNMASQSSNSTLLEDLFLKKIYPNPAMDEIFISLNSPIEQEVEIQIFDTRGVLVKKTTVSLVNGKNKKSISIGEFSHGVYSVFIPQVKDGVSSLRFIKM